MEKVIIVLAKSRFWLVVFLAFLVWFFILLSFFNSDSTAAGKASTLVTNTVHRNFAIFPDDEVIAVIKQNDTKTPENDDPCAGRYIYIHQIPSKFNADLLNHCRSLSNWTDMCELRSNHGFGPRLASSFGDRGGWFATNQFSLEVIFHSRMKSSYHCLTNDSSSASVIFIPYYAGLDVARHLWGGSNGDGGVEARDSDSLELAKWLRRQPEWQRLSGRDHFLVAGRVTWDFRRLSNDRDNDWGNRLLLLPETRNMTVLTIESSPWHDNDFAVPYPTYFHPTTVREVRLWQERMRSQKRRILFSFAGAPRAEIGGSIRSEIIKQCKRSSSKRKRRSCMILGPNKCRDPISVMKMFQSSVFCLQPRGDSSTRKSAFDAIVAGCVPVFFHPGSAYVQYLWHLPRDYAKYSVFIPEAGVKNGTVSLERVLAAIGRKRVAAMREEVVKLIPKVVYGSSRLGGGVEDAFDVAVSKVLERVDKIRSGVSIGSFGREELSWKYNFFGSVDQGNEWDHYFSTS